MTSCIGLYLVFSHSHFHSPYTVVTLISLSFPFAIYTIIILSPLTFLSPWQPSAAGGGSVAGLLPARRRRRPVDGPGGAVAGLRPARRAPNGRGSVAEPGQVALCPGSYRDRPVPSCMSVWHRRPWAKSPPSCMFVQHRPSTLASPSGNSAIWRRRSFPKTAAQQ